MWRWSLQLYLQKHGTREARILYAFDFSTIPRLNLIPELIKVSTISEVSGFDVKMQPLSNNCSVTCFQDTNLLIAVQVKLIFQGGNGIWAGKGLAHEDFLEWKINWFHKFEFTDKNEPSNQHGEKEWEEKLNTTKRENKVNQFPKRFSLFFLSGLNYYLANYAERHLPQETSFSNDCGLRVLTFNRDSCMRQLSISNFRTQSELMHYLLLLIIPYNICNSTRRQNQNIGITDMKGKRSWGCLSKKNK